MGNTGSNGAGGSNSRRRSSSHNRHHHDHHHNHSSSTASPPPSQQQQPPPPNPPEVPGNRYVFAAATPYPPQYPNPNPPPYHQYSGYYPPQYPNPNPPPYHQFASSYTPLPTMPVPLPAPFDPHHRSVGHHGHHPNWVGEGGRYSGGPPAPAPYVEHQKAVTIRNDVNLKKETLRIEPDEKNSGQFLVAFNFDATVAGSITVFFFAKEGFDCNLTSTKDNLLKPVTVSFKEGLGQKFRQPSGTGIDFSMFEEVELMKEGELEVYPLAVKAEASPSDHRVPLGESQKIGAPNSQITQAVFEKKGKDGYQVRVVKQILWVNGTRYELQEIYGIQNSVDGDFDGNDPGKECVICLSEPRDTTVLPCRHMCMCSECAKVLRFQTNRCPICRQPVERLLEIKVNNNQPEEQQEGVHG